MNACDTCVCTDDCIPCEDTDRVYRPGSPTCPRCGASSTGWQDHVSECKYGNWYTEFECGSRYIVVYRHCGSRMQEACIVSKVFESSKCILDGALASGNADSNEDIV